MSLRQTLQEIKDRAAERLPDNAREVMRRATRQLAESGQVEKTLGAGDTMPAFTLRNHQDVPVDSAELLRQGPLVLQFYRGIW